MSAKKKAEEDSLDDRQQWSPATRNVLPGAKVAPPAQARWMSKPFLRLLATNMAFGFSVSTFYLLPKHLTVAYAATPGTLGAVMGIFGLTCVLVVPWLGGAVNRIGLVRTLCLAQILMAACAFAFASLHSVGVAMLVLRTLQGLATAGYMTAGLAMVCALAPPERLVQAMGLGGAASLVMNAIAPAIAEPIGARWGFAWVFALSGTVALVGARLASTLPRQARLARTTATLALPARSRSVLLALAFSGAGFNVVMTFLSPLALPRGVNAVSGFFAAYTIAALGIRILGAGLTDRLGLKQTTVASMLLYGAVIAAVAAVGPRSLVVFGLLFGLAHGALYPALMAMLFRESSPAERAPLAGLSNGVMNLGMLTVLAFGQMANHLGLVPVFLITGSLVAASALLVRDVAAESPTKRRDEPILLNDELSSS
jgi:MFS family permease